MSRIVALDTTDIVAVVFGAVGIGFWLLPTYLYDAWGLTGKTQGPLAWFGVQERTVKAHLTAIFERLGVRNRTQASVVLRELELSDPSRQL